MYSPYCNLNLRNTQLEFCIVGEKSVTYAKFNTEIPRFDVAVPHFLGNKRIRILKKVL